jgi:putative methionine-R-sulfoxide reductase with GAF domain
LKSIKHQFIATAITITFFLMVLGFFTNLSVRRTYQNYTLIQTVEKLGTLTAMMDKTSKDFVLNESVNPEFFISGHSKYSDLMDDLMQEYNILLAFLGSNRIVNKLALIEELEGIKNHFDSIGIKFNYLQKAIYDYGFESHGLSGKMRAHIHKVESTLEEESRYELTAMMLMLRRHEKDFMLRKDSRYLDRFEQTMERFVGRMQQLGVNHGLVNMAADYNIAFKELAAKDMEIGTISSDGLLGQINNEFIAAEPLINKILGTISEHSGKQLSIYLWTPVLAFVLLSLAIIFVYFRLSGRIVKQLKAMKTYLGRLGNGELPERIEYRSNDEIGQMIDSINNLTDNLKNTRSFAIEVGRGNFNTEINVFGNRGDLGGSLIQMKNQLEEVDRMQKKQKEEETERNWSAEGSAIFAQILRQSNDDMTKMIDSLIQTLVNYLNVNQGGFFLIEEHDDVKYLEMVGCYAYDRKKFLKKQILWGEGLIGACAMEKESIYVTDLPKDYIYITSGLGHTTPDFLFIVPLIHEDTVLGVLEIAGFGNLENYKKDFLERISSAIAAQISILKSNIYNKSLLKRSEELAWNLRQQEEELKQNMEEMLAAREESDRVIEALRRELSSRDCKIVGYTNENLKN